MSLGFFRPGPPLDAFVERFWSADPYVAPAPRERVLPAGTLDLVVNLEVDRVRFFEDEGRASPTDLPGMALFGAQTRPLVVAASPKSSAVGVHFKPGGARAFVDVPVGELEDGAVPADVFWGAAARWLRERLLDASTHAARFRVLEAFLRARVRPRRTGPALREALLAFDEPGLPSVAEVNRRTGLSPKRLIALFREEVGLSPKAFWRVRRFRAALRDLDRGARNGAALAVDAGYFDQAHFDREFRRLAGLSPREYLSARVERPNHVPMHG